MCYFLVGPGFLEPFVIFGTFSNCCSDALLNEDMLRFRWASALLWGRSADGLGMLWGPCTSGMAWGCSGDAPTSPTTACPADWGNVLDYNAEPRRLDMGGEPLSPGTPHFQLRPSFRLLHLVLYIPQSERWSRLKMRAWRWSRATICMVAAQNASVTMVARDHLDGRGSECERDDGCGRPSAWSRLSMRA